MNRQQKELPMGMPPITSYHYIADLLAILSKCDRDGMRIWLCGNYIQLVIPEIGSNYDFYRLDFYSHLPWKDCPYLFYQCLSRDLISKGWGNICDLLVDSIDLGNYIFVDVDNFYLSASRYFNRTAYPHEIFIFGYDKESKTFSAAEFFRGGAYSFIKVPFDEVKSAYDSITLMKTSEYGYPDCRNGIELIKYRSDRKCEFNFYQVINDIEDYLYSRRSCIRYRVPFSTEKKKWDYSEVYGMDIYQNVLHFLKNLPVKADGSHDIRMLHVLWDHKIAMCMRIEYMGQNGWLDNYRPILEKYHNIEHRCLLTRNLLIKYYMVRKKEYVEKMINSINWVISEERSALELLLHHIR